MHALNLRSIALHERLSLTTGDGHERNTAFRIATANANLKTGQLPDFPERKAQEGSCMSVLTEVLNAVRGMMSSRVENAMRTGLDVENATRARLIVENAAEMPDALEGSRFVGEQRYRPRAGGSREISKAFHRSWLEVFSRNDPRQGRKDPMDCSREPPVRNQ